MTCHPKTRPNTSLHFPLSAEMHLSPSKANVLNPWGIAELLHHYPNQRFVDTLISIALHGVTVGYTGSLNGQTRRPNHTSTFTYPEVLTKSIQSEIVAGRIVELPTLPANYFCSPLGLTPKMADGIQTGWRTIFDLSSPEGSSVNDGIPKEFGSLVYETLNDAIRLVTQAGKNAILVKRDLKSAFRHVPISPCDYWLLIFEWQGCFYVDMFLPFGLRTAPRIFNLFAEALHWIFETLYEWNVTHYLDDFLFVFPAGTDSDPISKTFDQVLATFGLSKAAEKDSQGRVVVHLGFEFDSSAMEIRLPPNKKQRALDAINSLLSSSTVSLSSLESTLGFLSHCCQVVPLGRPFLRHLYSLISRCTTQRAAKDLRWWLRFLTSWSAVSMIQPSRPIYDIATDASGIKGIGGVFQRQVFSKRIPARHRLKHINWKEMFAVLYAFLLWHQSWRGGSVRLACDNATVVDAISKCSMKGNSLRPLQDILLVAAVFDITLSAFWIPSEENIVADAASRHDFGKLANLGLQVSPQKPSLKISTLRQTLSNFSTIPSPRPPTAIITPSENPTVSSAAPMDIPHSPLPSKASPIGLVPSCAPPNLQLPKVISMPSAPTISSLGSPPLSSTTPASNSLSVGANAFMVRAPNDSVSHLHRLSSSELSMNSIATKKESISNQRSVWHLPPSYDLENLHGIAGLLNTISPTSHANMSSSMLPPTQ